MVSAFIGGSSLNDRITIISQYSLYFNTNYSLFNTFAGCFRDAIISELFPIIYKQTDNKYSYIRVEKTPKYVKTNIGAVTVGTTINIFLLFFPFI